MGVQVNDIPIAAKLGDVAIGVVVLLELPYNSRDHSLWIRAGNIADSASNPAQQKIGLYRLIRTPQKTVARTIERPATDLVFPVTIEHLDLHLTPTKEA